MPTFRNTLFHLHRRLNFICQRFGTFCSIFIGIWILYANVSEHPVCSIFVPTCLWRWNRVFHLHWRLNFIRQNFGKFCLFHLHRRLNFICQRFGTLWLFHLRTYLLMKVEQSVPKRWHIKFRSREITQKKTYNIQKNAKFLNQGFLKFTKCCFYHHTAIK
jgi:hypothetical protein